MFKLPGSRPLNYQSHAWDACSVERWRQSRANILTTGQTKPVRENTVSPDVMHGSRRDLVHVDTSVAARSHMSSVTMQISIAGSSVSTVWGVALCLGVTLETLFEPLRRHFECKVDTCKSHVLGQLTHEANNRIRQICVSLVKRMTFWNERIYPTFSTSLAAFPKALELQISSTRNIAFILKNNCRGNAVVSTMLAWKRNSCMQASSASDGERT